MFLFCFFHNSTNCKILDKETKNCNISSDINLKLHKSNKLIDENFVFIKRDENATTLVDNFDKLAERYLNCFYRNENSAMDLCDGNVVSKIEK